VPEIYNHPNIRELAHDELIDRLSDIRNRRLLAALDFKAAHEERMQKLSTKFSEQYEKSYERIRLRLLKMADDIDRTDSDINKLIALSHKLTMTEEGVGL
jgi:hypothetical protein